MYRMTQICACILFSAHGTTVAVTTASAEEAHQIMQLTTKTYIDEQETTQDDSHTTHTLTTRYCSLQTLSDSDCTQFNGPLDITGI